MKNLVKLTLLAALLLCGSTTYAQKFGYVNSQELITAMPERDSALSKYQKFAQDQQSQLETIQVEFNNKYLDYQKNAETLSESAKQLKERELQDLQKRFDDFQQVAEQDAQKMQQQLMGPVITKGPGCDQESGPGCQAIRSYSMLRPVQWLTTMRLP